MVNHSENRNGSAFDMQIIIKYIILFVLSCLVIFGINKIVLYALSISPTDQVGNNMLTLYEVHNPGAAFNIFSEQPAVLIMISIMILAILIFVLITRSGYLKYNAVSSMALLSSGIFMNLMDRLSHGYVIDYISCNFAPSFPVFNTADILIVCGALGIIIALFNKN